MEAAALGADTRGELEAALRLCEVGGSSRQAVIASARILELAGNTARFRAAIPRIEKLIAADAGDTQFLREALIAAAEDGVPGLAPLALARQAGLLTDWRVAGPFGEFPNIAFERAFRPETEGLQPQQAQRPRLPGTPAGASSEGIAVEAFRFEDGVFDLPDYYSEAGVFYAESSIETARSGAYLVRVESESSLEVSVDGARALRKDVRFHAAPEIVWTVLQLSAGTHRVLVKFVPSAAPFRVALIPGNPGLPAGDAVANAGVMNLRPAAKERAAIGPARKLATPRVAPESAIDPAADYLDAAERFWQRDYATAIALLTLLEGQRPSAAVDYLLAQAWSRAGDESPEEPALLESAVKRAPLALAAQQELAAEAYDAGRFDEAFALASRIAAQRPEYVPAQNLLALSAARMHLVTEAREAALNQIRLHPVCTTLGRGRLLCFHRRLLPHAAVGERAGGLCPRLVELCGGVGRTGTAR